MQSRALSALLALLFLGLFTLASSADIQKRSFIVKRVPNPMFQGRNGPRELAKTYRKYRMPLPPGLNGAVVAQDARLLAAPPPKRASRLMARAFSRIDGQAGIAAANPADGGTEFVSPVTIGGQTFSIALDTGSSDLWVFSTLLSPDIVNGRRVYDPTKSSSFRQSTGNQFNVLYGDGSAAQGPVGTDDIIVGGAVVPSQPVGLASSVSQSFREDFENDGIMGLGFESLNTIWPQRGNTFLGNIAPTLNEPVFTADLRGGSRGGYTFGLVDPSKFQGDLTWIPTITSDGFWQFSSQRFAVNNGSPQDATPGGQAIADTGTTLIVADPIIVNAYYSTVPGVQHNETEGGYTFPCNQPLPNLDLDVGGVYVARIPGDDIRFMDLGGGTCFGGLQPAPQGSVGIYGDIFFKSQFVVFNAGNSTLAMAPHS